MDDELTVHTPTGSYRGAHAPRSQTGTVVLHQGIPYAAAPFGEHRFAAPALPEPADGVRDCTAPGPPAPQGELLLGAARWTPGSPLDCLVLNVWSSARAGDQAPVLVWIHGGAYLVGSASEPTYDGTRLAETGLVVVGINYRVGFEGFGHVPGRPDNRGLLDQIAALRWVREHIPAFGGDPGNVTVAGESAGAGSVAALMAMPGARGLFHRAIAHSPPGDMVHTGTARLVSERFAQTLGVPLEAEALAALPPEKILEATEEVLTRTDADGRRTRSMTCFAPVVGGPELPEAPLEAIARGEASGIDLLTGHNLHEYRLFSELGQNVGVDDEQALQRKCSRLGLGPDEVAAYREIRPELSPRDLYVHIMGDAVFGEFTLRLAETHAAAGGHAHVFRLTLESPALRGRLGACHALDLPFAFGTLESELGAFLLGGEPADTHRALSRRLMNSWHDFAATGDAGWPPVTTGATPVKIWDEADELHSHDPSPAREIWRGIDLAPK
ncbi:carboxylesterase/lipase family protein [Nocardiopsis kunsanensis]|uniref:carboxylesterase/lipase family protein n=1 Tax=Nocardiopsis kunsanensis TaxID=141693 RepID=UPI00034793CA|nr:carboxylesterase family protein [Nocardiopsis kunsanensis]